MPCNLKTGPIPANSTSARSFLRPQSLVSTPKEVLGSQKGTLWPGRPPPCPIGSLSYSLPPSPWTTHCNPICTLLGLHMPCSVALGFHTLLPRCIPVSMESCEVVLCQRGLLLTSGTILTSITLSTTATVHFTDVETKAQHDGSSPV